MWKLLSEIEDEVIYRGSRIRVEILPNNGEDHCVDFMVFHTLCNPSDGFSLLRVSGYKAGHLGVTLPEESRLDGVNGISVKWFKRNWKKWAPIDGKAENIWIGPVPPSAYFRR
jgi:hypothetical protein